MDRILVEETRRIPGEVSCTRHQKDIIGKTGNKTKKRRRKIHFLVNLPHKEKQKFSILPFKKEKNQFSSLFHLFLS